MRKRLFVCFSAVIGFFGFPSGAQTVQVLYTTDVHGNLFCYDFVRDSLSSYSLSNAYAYVSAVRDTAQNVVLLDAGDFLQGSPSVYYYNNIDTMGINVAAQVFNYMKYDAVCIGNHDIEARHRVYDKVVKEIDAPIICANIKNVKTGKPYFQPYTIVEKAGKRIAVLGLCTPYIPHWLPEHFWVGMEFEDMIESAQYWINYLKENEKTDYVIGLFHSGFDFNYANQNAESYKNENASLLVAQRVEGFDAIMIGHDHRLYNKTVDSPSGHEIPILDAGMSGRNIGMLTINFDAEGGHKSKTQLINMLKVKSSEEYDKHFAPQVEAVKDYTHRVVGVLTKEVRSAESLFGSSPFCDVVHTIMLEHTGADISMTAPLLVDVYLPAGPLTVGRLFSLYRYENSLCVIRLSGTEILRYLEYSYEQWVSNPKKSGHILKLDDRQKLLNKYYNMDSAAGIIYVVDVTKPVGHRVKILSMADGTPFDCEKTYKVALNSYRANGGGGHLEVGVGIPFDKLAERIEKTIDTDLRGIIIEELTSKGKNGKPFYFEALNQWRFVPDDVVAPFIEQDKKMFK